jgi:metacaspase-1
VDDGDHPQPTKAAILNAYRWVVAQSQPGDSIFLHYSGHGTKVPDQNGDEEDGYDEALVPSDYASAGVILDDELYEIIVKGLAGGVHVVSVVSVFL